MPIQCQVLSYSSRGNHDLMGKLFSSSARSQYLRHHQEQCRVGSSQIHFNRIRLHPDFFGFIQAGIRMLIIACIGFTGTMASRPDERAFTIRALAIIPLMSLNPVGRNSSGLGRRQATGATLRVQSQSSYTHFNTQAVHGQTHAPEVYQLEELLNTYRSAIYNIEFSGNELV